MLVIDEVLAGFNGILMLAVAVPTLYMATRIKLEPVRIAAILPATFLVIHGSYHLVDFIGGMSSVSLLFDLGDGLLAPLSYASLVLLAFYLERKGG